jgi:CHAT domain-containing protein/predicted negative regulator of RcsB-dependent stress response
MQTAVKSKCKQVIVTVRQVSKRYSNRQKSVPLFLLVIALVLLSPSTFAQSPQPVEELAKRLINANAAERKTLLETEKLTPELTKALITEGERFSEQQQWQQSLDTYKLAQSVAIQIHDRAGEASILLSIGRDFFDQSRYDEALGYYEQGLQIRREINDTTGIASTLRNIAAVHRLRGEYDKALDLLQQCYALIGEVKNQTVIGGILIELGNVYYARGDYPQTLRYYNDALRVYQEAHYEVGIAGTESNIGVIQTILGEYDAALESFNRVLKSSQERGNKTLMATAQNEIGNIYFERGDYSRAIEFYEQSLKTHTETGDQYNIAIVLSNIASIHNQQGNFPPALNAYQKALSIKNALGDRPGIAETMLNIAEVYHQQDDLKQAEEYIQKALRLSLEIKDEHMTAAADSKLGAILQEQGKLSESLAHLQNALSLYEKSADNPGMATALSGLAQLYLKQDKPQKAAPLVDRAIKVAAEIPESLWFALTLKSRLQQRLKQTGEARRTLDEAIRIVERLRATAAGDEKAQFDFLAKKIIPYEDMLSLLVEQQDTTAALACAERMKARLLFDVLQSGRVNVTKEMTDAEKAEERRLNQEIFSLNTQIYNERARAAADVRRLSNLTVRLEKARLNQQDFQTRLYAAHPNLKLHRGESPSFNLQQAASLLDTGTALLEYASTADQIYLFVLTKSSDAAAPNLKTYELKITEDELKRLTEDFRGRLASHNLLFRNQAMRLYDLLIKPAQAQLQGKTKLVIVPDGVLWELPFQALQPQAERYLIEDASLFYVPSLAVFDAMNKERNAVAREAQSPVLLAFGNPALGLGEEVVAQNYRMRDSTLRPLPEAESEVKALAQMYGKARSKIYVGASASEDRLKAEAGNYRILHLATHSLLDDASPMYSQIVLSQTDKESGEDGLLETWEILQLNLHSELVILSACETARGRVHIGEGMIGLTWAFFVAGAPATLVSQWKVDATSTTALMLDFHAVLKPQITDAMTPQSKAEALRSAALKMLKSKDRRHPFYWAAFVLIGDGN